MRQRPESNLRPLSGEFRGANSRQQQTSTRLNAHSLDVCVLPISTAQHRAFSLRPELKAGEAGLRHNSWVKCDQPSTVEKDLVVYPPVGSVSTTNMQKIEAAVKAALDLP